MADLFLKILNTSIAAGWFVLAVVALRPLLKKAPRWIHVLLWGMVAMRLLLPFSIESVLSMVPSAETVPPQIMLEENPTISSGIHVLNSVVNPVISETFSPTPGASANPLQIWIGIAAFVWLTGVAAMGLYTAISYWRLYRKVSTAVLEQDNIFRSEFVASPFVLGIFRPKIYLPAGMTAQNAAHVIAHEQSHIHRRDHWWKPLGFLLLAIHWFHPLMWLAYILLCRDIEMACDEKVVRKLDSSQRADYSQALLSCSISRRSIAACPLAFGEVGVKERVKNVLNYKKPAFWLIIIAIVACIAMAVCFLTDPVKEPQQTETQPSETHSTTLPSKAFVLYDRHDDNSPNEGELQLEALPGVTLRWNFTPNLLTTAEPLVLVKDGVETPLFTQGGLVTAVYVNDVTKDGYPDLCANVYYIFSGLPSFNMVVVYDCVNNSYYNLVASPNDNKHSTKCSYCLHIEGGYLICDKIKESTAEVLLSGLLAFADSANGGMLYLAPLPDALQTAAPQVYIWGEDGKLEDACLILHNDGTFSFMFSPYCSYIGFGTYTIDGATLTARTSDGKYTYVFTIVEDGMRFEAESSSDLSHVSELYDGAILRRKNTAQ